MYLKLMFIIIFFQIGFELFFFQNNLQLNFFLEQTEDVQAVAFYDFNLHLFGIKCIKFSPVNYSDLFTLCSDGTVKCVDLNKFDFKTIHEGPEMEPGCN